jgi:prolyl oligopeptidase
MIDKPKTRSIRLLALAVILLVTPRIPSAQTESTQGHPKYPETPKQPVTDTYWGTTVTENYRWLENWDDPKVKTWVDEQNKLTHGLLDGYPERTAIAKYLKKLYGAESSSYFALRRYPGGLFAIKHQPPKEQPFLVTLASPDDTSHERIVVDPNAIDPSGLTTIDFYYPSHDGRLVAVSLSKAGSEDGTLHIYEVAAGKTLDDTIPHVTYPTAGGSIAWNVDNTGFYYTRYPSPGEKKPEDAHFFQQVYYHKLGTPQSADKYAIGKDFPRIAEVALQTSEDGKYILATVENGDGGQYAHFLQGPSGNWTQITQFDDRISEARFGQDQFLYLLSRKDAPKGKILQMPLNATELSKTKIVVPESDASIQNFQPTAGRLYIVDMVGGPNRIRVLDLSAGSTSVVSTEPVSSIRDLIWTNGDEILYNEESYVAPSAWYHYEPSTKRSAITQMRRMSPVNFDDAEVVREFATSKDGTKVPINILRRKSTQLNFQNPTILYAYGGYGINMTPSFSVFRRIWLDQGGVYAIANIRGGAEFGDDWHLAGNLTRKQNVFDDFAACAKYMIDAGYTNPSKFAIEGGSNGGLLMGAALTQHPDYYQAVVSYVGIYDMLRVELSPNGEFNTTEFGTVKKKDHFEALYAYSPYHHVVDGANYPAVLFITGEHDGRVDPANSRKMTARLQTATKSDRPVLLRQSSSSGHGIGTSFSEGIEEDADVLSFLFSQLGMNYKEPK